MPEVDRYDVLVVGSGESGKYLAWTMAAAGHRTAVVERQLIGGSGPHVACLPSKNIIHSAKVKSLAARASAFGLETGAISTDMNAVQERKRRMERALRRSKNHRRSPRRRRRKDGCRRPCVYQRRHTCGDTRCPRVA